MWGAFSTAPTLATVDFRAIRRNWGNIGGSGANSHQWNGVGNRHCTAQGDQKQQQSAQSGGLGTPAPANPGCPQLVPGPLHSPLGTSFPEDCRAEKERE